MQPYNLNKVIDDTFTEISRSRENYKPEFRAAGKRNCKKCLVRHSKSERTSGNGV